MLPLAQQLVCMGDRTSGDWLRTWIPPHKGRCGLKEREGGRAPDPLKTSRYLYFFFIFKYKVNGLCIQMIINGGENHWNRQWGTSGGWQCSVSKERSWIECPVIICKVTCLWFAISIFNNSRFLNTLGNVELCSPATASLLPCLKTQHPW